MELAKDNETILEDFKELFNLYKILKSEINALEGKNGYIQQIFQEWNAQTYNNMFRNRRDINLVLNQEKTERTLQQKQSKNSLRFYTPYYDKYANEISKGNLPEFFKSKKVDLKIDLSFNKFDKKSYLQAQKNFSELTDAQKLQEKAKVLKELAIIYARQANIFNRFKTSEKVEFIEAIRK